jgi:hypothetical protein
MSILPERFPQDFRKTDSETAAWLDTISKPTTYATLEPSTNGWLARILEPGKAPCYFVPSKHDRIATKGGLVRAVNRAHPGVLYLSERLFNARVEEAQS